MMKSFLLLATLQLAGLVLANPFIIVTAVPQIEKRDPQGLGSALSSLLNPGDDDSSKASTSVGAPVAAGPSTATASRTKLGKATSVATTSATSTSSTDDSDASTTTDDSSTTESTSTTSSSSTSSTSTMPSTTSATPTPTSSSTGVVTPALQSSNSSSGNGVPAAGVAVAVIAAVAIIVITIWMVFRYNDKARAWWDARQDAKKNERSYREALDGPTAASAISQAREKASRDSNPAQAYANGATAVAANSNRRKSALTSFFAPRTADLGGGQQIRRKPVNWGGDATGESQGGEKMSLAATAAPMGQSDPMAFAHARESAFIEEPYEAHHSSPSLDRPLPVLPSLGFPESTQPAKARRGSDGVFRLN